MGSRRRRSVHSANNKKAAERIQKQIPGSKILKLGKNEREVFGCRYLVGKPKK